MKLLKKMTACGCLIIISGFIFSCNWFNPPTEPAVEVESGYESPTTPEILFNNLRKAFFDKDIDRYEEVFHPDFIYRSPSKIDSLDVWWDLATERRIIHNMFDNVEEMWYTRGENRFYPEYGSNMDYPDTSNVSDEHPDELWLVFDNYVTIDIIGMDYQGETGDYFVQQDMIYKVVKDTDTGLYSIIRWIDVVPESWSP